MNEDKIEKAPNVPAFVRFVASTIPMVFDDSMSYYEALANLVHYIQDTVDVVNNNATVTEEYIQLTKDMKEYMDHYFDNLNVQNEINNKLDAMAKDGTFASIFNEYFSDYVNPQIESQNNRITSIEDKVNAATSSAPIPVSSIASMTDHNKIYVLTSDGHWYYWNSATSTWTSGGTYQASSLGSGSVGFGNLTNQLGGFITEVSNDVTKLHNIKLNNNANSVNFTSPMLLKAGTTISVSSDFVANYQWRLTRVNPDLPIKLATVNANVNNLNTNTSYTLVNDELCVFQWVPIDGNWETTDYTVDRFHKLDNNDVTITYYWQKDDRYKLIDINSSYIYNTLFASVNYDSGITSYDGSRLSTVKLYSSYPILLHTKSGYNYDIAYYDNGDYASPRTSHTGWSTGDVIIPKNKWFLIGFKKSDNSAFNATDYADIFDLNSYANYSYVDQYIDNHISSVGTTYNYEGINIDMQYKHGYNIETYTAIPEGYRGMQGMAIYGNYIVSFSATSNGTIRIFDKTSGSLLAEHGNLGTVHSGSCSFSNEFYDSNDTFPLLYVSTGYSGDDGNQIKVLRIQDINTVTTVKSYHFDVQEIGYASEQCFDFETGLCYSFGYTQNSYSDPTNNPTIVCVYNINKEKATTGGSNISLELVERYTIPFVYCVQSCRFLNGYCFIPSSYQSNVQASNILVYDPQRRTFVADFPQLPQPLRGEIEALDFIKNTTTSKYDMIVAVNGGANYWKLSFM